MSTARQSQIHASCVAFDAGAALLRGPPGAGKSDLALRLVDRGGMLVADDRVELSRDGDRLFAASPAALHGLIELRGIGIVSLPAAPRATVTLVVDLMPRAQIERLPEKASAILLGIAIPRIEVDPFDASAAIKVALALRCGLTIVAELPAA